MSTCRSINKFLVGIILLLSFKFAFDMWLDDKYVVPVMMYHHVDKSDIARADTVSPDNFRMQLQYLKDNGYTVLRLKQLVEMIEGGMSNAGLPRKSVVLTR